MSDLRSLLPISVWEVFYSRAARAAAASPSVLGGVPSVRGVRLLRLRVRGASEQRLPMRQPTRAASATDRSSAVRPPQPAPLPAACCRRVTGGPARVPVRSADLRALPRGSRRQSGGHGGWTSILDAFVDRCPACRGTVEGGRAGELRELHVLSEVQPLSRQPASAASHLLPVCSTAAAGARPPYRHAASTRGATCAAPSRSGGSGGCSGHRERSAEGRAAAMGGRSPLGTPTPTHTLNHGTDYVPPTTTGSFFL